MTSPALPLWHSDEERRKRDAHLPFEEKIAIVLELQQASALLRAAHRAAELS